MKLSRDGLVLAAVPVAFQGEDGRILEVVTTDSGGEATGTMEPNGMVTFPNDFARTLETHAGLQIGHELVITDDLPADPVIGTATAMFPGTFAGATRYVLKIACGPAAVSAELGAIRSLSRSRSTSRRAASRQTRPSRSPPSHTRTG